MPTIRPLSNSLINKIAAGEVIERPASVVKELLENSIDAGATRIELTVEGGGTDLIRISDNGCGIESEELLLAVSPHATSKLIEADDLFDIHTLGFRGEALASIAEISHLVLRSRATHNQSGSELRVTGGERLGPDDCASPVGTTIEVRHLFFNTPVRKKFLKAPQTEMGHTIEAFTRIALAHPRVHMVLISNDRTLHDLPATTNWSERIDTFFGSEVSDNLIHVDSQDSGIRLHGYVVDPAVSRSNNRMQYLFLNGRYIRDRALQHALGEAYRGLLMVGRFPICFLHLEIPANQVDVNVHPTKSEVRFLDGGEIYRRLLQTLRAKFLLTDLTARVRPSTHPGLQDEQSTSLNPNSPSPNHPSIWSAPVSAFGHSPSNSSTANTQTASSLATLMGRGVPEFQPFNDAFRRTNSPVLPSSNGFEFDTPRSQDPTTPAPFPTSNPSWNADSTPDSNQGAVPSQENFRTDREHFQPAGSHLGFQIHNRYLVTQDDSGMVVIDQHALHERIMYEQIRERVLSKSMESQRLLIPEPITLTPTEAAAALEVRETLEQIGISIEPFGGDTILVTAYPAMLANITPAEMVRKVLEPLIESGKKPEARDLLDSMMHMMSCKAAIKAGDKLTPEEITSLLEQRHIYADTHHCPHGRPTALFFSREQLDKMFKRT